MKTAVTAYSAAPDLMRARALAYLELTKPRVAVLVLFTVATGALLADRGTLHPMILLSTVCGTALVAAGASALNQFFERQRDALMRRTENRPLPSGRLLPVEALVLGIGLGVAGVLALLLTLPQPWAALVATVTFICYVFVYTPLKQKTPLNTLVGAVPGALPPLIGWTAVRGTLGWEGCILFVILFLWQVPHFLAIAWIYREDYAGAGYQMLSVVDRDGSRTARGMVSYCLALLGASLVPVLLGMAGLPYFVGAVLLGLGFLVSTVRFARRVSEWQARRVLKASLAYLPGLLALLLLDGWINRIFD
jgi:protoheme IX farnesyltransferase